MTTDPISVYKVEPTPEQRRGIYLTIAVLVLFMLAVLAGLIHKINQPRILTHAELRANGAIQLQHPRVLDEFELIADSGEPYKTSALEGRWTLVFFGFTHCPDVCPTTLTTLNNLYQSLDDATRKDTDVLLVSVDPQRDKPQLLRDYVDYFNSDFSGITGEFFNLKRFANQLNVPFNKVTLKNGDYTVDHGSQIVLINPRGHYHAFFKAPLDPVKIKLTYLSMRESFNG